MQKKCSFGGVAVEEWTVKVTKELDWGTEMGKDRLNHIQKKTVYAV